jgi:hypothetical protein
MLINSHFKRSQAGFKHDLQISEHRVWMVTDRSDLEAGAHSFGELLFRFDACTYEVFTVDSSFQGNDIQPRGGAYGRTRVNCGTGRIGFGAKSFTSLGWRQCLLLRPLEEWERRR